MSVPPAEPSEPEPQPGFPRPRIGDAERDRAVGFLQEHMTQGRLDHAEFDERLTRALQARTAADLEPLFHDLPDPRPGGLVPTTPYSAPPWSATGASAVPASPSAEAVPAPVTNRPRAVALTMSALWPATVLLYVVTDFRFWWLFVVAAMVSYFVNQAFGPEKRSSPRHRIPTPHPPPWDADRWGCPARPALEWAR